MHIETHIAKTFKTFYELTLLYYLCSMYTSPVDIVVNGFTFENVIILKIFYSLCSTLLFYNYLPLTNINEPCCDCDDLLNILYALGTS